MSTGNRGEVSVQLVIGFDEETTISIGKNSGELAYLPIDDLAVFVVQNNGE